MEGMLPNSILYAPKAGFGVPYQLWLKGPLWELFHDSISQLKIRKCNVLNWVYVEALIKENNMSHRDNSFMLWKILNLMIWLLEND
jgi:asparagine synthase (glutamine-hydrolysing)